MRNEYLYNIDKYERMKRKKIIARAVIAIAASIMIAIALAFFL